MEPDVLPDGQPTPDENAEIRLGIPSSKPVETAQPLVQQIVNPTNNSPQSASKTPVIIDAFNQAMQQTGTQTELIDSYRYRTDKEKITTELGKLKFTQFGQFDVTPTSQNISILRQNRNNPEAIAAFEWKYGKGSSDRYLRLPSDDYVSKLIRQKDNPEAVQAFDLAFGGVSNLFLILSDPKSTQVAKEAAAYRLIQVYNTGHIPPLAGLAEAGRSGFRKTIGETFRAGVAAYDYFAGTKYANQVAVPDVTGKKFAGGQGSEMLFGALEGITQFATGRIALGGLLPRSAEAGRIAGFLREMALSGAVDAFMFNPDDPRLADLAKSLGLDNPFTTDKLDTDWKKRFSRFAEGAALGTLFESISLGVRAFRAARSGDSAGAAALSSEAKLKLNEAAEQFEPRQVEMEPRPPVGTEPRQLEMDLPAPVGDEAAQARMSRITEPGIPESVTQPSLPMDMPVQRNLDQLPDFATPTPRETLQETLQKIEAELASSRPTEAELSVRNTEDVVGDALNNRGPAQRALAEASGNINQSFMPKAVRELLDSIPDFSNYTSTSLREATSPILNDFLNVAKTSPEDMARIISRNMSMEDATKLQALLTQASERANALSTQFRVDLNLATSRTVTDVFEIDAIKSIIKNNNDFVANIQKAFEPLGTASGRLLQIRQMAGPIATAFKKNVDNLRAKGVTESQINSLIADAIHSVDTTRLDRAIAKKKLAISRNELAKATELDKEISAAAKAVEKEAKNIAGARLGQATSFMGRLSKDVQSLIFKSMLSSPSTSLRAAAGSMSSKIWDNASLLSGSIREQGLLKGYSFYKELSNGRALGVRSGFESLRDAYLDMAWNAIKNSWNNNPKASGLGFDASKKTQTLNAANYVSSGVGQKTLQVGFSIADKMDLPLRITDEFMADWFNRAGVGEAAAYRFVLNRSDQLSEIKAKLRDPSISNGRRASLNDDLKKMTSSNPKIQLEDGSWVSVKDFVDKEMRSSFDETGRFINEAVADRTDYLLLKNEFSSRLAQQAEGLLSTPAATPLRMMFLPFLRNPVNGFKMYMETVPGLRGVFSDINLQLTHPDPLVRMRAEGKIMLGWAVQGTAFLGAYYGFTTYANMRDRKQRELNNASSSFGNATLWTPWGGLPMQGIDPLSGHFLMAPAIVDTIKRRFHQIESEQEIYRRDSMATPYTEKEMLLKYGGAILSASLFGIGSILLDQPATTSMRDILDLIPGSSKQGPDSDPDFDKSLGKLLRNQIGKFKPAAIRAGQNITDTNMYNVKSVWDVFLHEFGSRSNLALQYDAIGRPIQSKNPFRGVAGPFFPQYNREVGTKEQYVIDALQRMGDMTGSYIVFNDSPPDVVLKNQKIDFSRIKAELGERRLTDEVAKVLRTVRPGGLPTLTDRLFDIFSNEANLARKGIGYGNAKFDGRLPKIVSDVMRQYREAAWKIVLQREQDARNVELIKEMSRGKAGQYWSKSPQMDRPYSDSLQPLYPTR